MKAYVIVTVQVLNADAYKEYRELAHRAVLKHGGTYLARSGAVEILEGDWPCDRAIVILEFQDMAAAHGWHESPEYGRALACSEKAFNRQMVIVEGVA